MRLFGKKRRSTPHLGRQESLSAKPVLNRLVKVERGEDGKVMLQIPRRDSGMVRAVSRMFHIAPYKRVALDELGTFVIELCDGNHTVQDVVDKFAERFKLNPREAELSMSGFLRNLARRSIIGLVIEGGKGAT